MLIFTTRLLLSSAQPRGLYLAFGIAAALVFVAVAGAVLYFGRKYRAGRGDKLHLRRHENKYFELLLTGGFVVLASGFMWVTLGTMRTIQDIPENPRPDIIVTGHQWWWEAEYTKGNFLVANEIHLPAGKRVLIQLKSGDVIHNWWVPKLGRKMDMIPGIDHNFIWLAAVEPGEYLGACSEFCGAQHARMRLRVTVEPEADFEAWSLAQQASAVEMGTEAFAAGKSLFNEKTCANCHRVNGTTAEGQVGPDLTHFGSRARFLADMKDNNPENIRAWLRDPHAVKPGVKMPNFILTEGEVSDLSAYLYQLK